MEKTLFTNRWYAIKPSRLVKKSPIEVPILGHNAVIWRNHDNQVVMQDNSCPHRGAKLSMGRVTKGRKCIECPYHGWTFDDEGSVVSVPAWDSPAVTDHVKINTWHTLESGGLVWCCLGNTLDTPVSYNPPVIKEMHDKDWISVTGQEVFCNDWITTLENSIDITHVNFVHSDFGDSQNGSVKDIDIAVKSHDHLRMYSSIHHKSENLLLKFSDNPDVRVRHDILLPNTVSIQFFVRDFLNVITYVTYTPLDDNKTLLNWVFLRNPRLGILDSVLNHFFIEGMQRAIREDKRIVDSLVNPKIRVSIHPDAIQNKFRSMLKTLKSTEPSCEFL